MISDSLKEVIAEAGRVIPEVLSPLPHNEAMESRVKKLEDGQQELKTQLVRIDTRLEHIEKSMVTKSDVSELRVDVLTNTEKAKTAVADLRADLHKMDASIKTWMIGTVIGMMVGFGGLFLSMNKSSAPAAQTQPVVIYAPAGSAAPVPVPVPAAPAKP